MRATERRKVTTAGRWTVMVPNTETKYESEAVDDRRNRKYGRKVTVYVKATDVGETAPDADLPYGEGIPHTEHALRDALEAALGKSRVKRVGSRGRTNRFEAVSEDNPWGISAELWLPADRPSETTEAEDVPARLDWLVAQATGDETEKGALARYMAATLDATLAAQEEARALNMARAQAERLAQWVAKAADRKAREACRFKARLEGLIAELKAEQEEQLKRALAEGGTFETGLARSDEEFDPRAVEVARKVADQFMPSARPGPFRGCGDRGLTYAKMVELTGSAEEE